LFIEQLEGWLHTKLREAGWEVRRDIAALGAVKIAFLLFADDLVLVAHTKATL
jgi:hypothetical protein